MKHCTNCNAEMHNDAVVCVSCGVPVGKAHNFCAKCGANIEKDAVICISCGAPCYESLAINSTKKSRIAAGILGILLGAFGIHNFYLGYTGKAVVQLVLTILSCGFLSFISGIWGIVEGIIILTDKNYVDASGKTLEN